MASLDDAVRDIRTEENQIAKRLSRSAERVGKIRESEAELCRKLAKLRLSPEMQKHVSGRLSNAELEARNVLKAHAAQISSSEKLLKAQDNMIAALAKSRHVTLDQLEHAQLRLKDISRTIADVIGEDPQYGELRSRADQLQTIADESLKKTELAEADQEQKGRPYRDDPLFMYLWDAGFGTQSYKANNLVRWLDGMVARLIGFHGARPNYAMLNQIPLRLREHAQRQILAAEEAEDALDQMEADAIVKAGGAPITKALDQAQEKLQKLDLDMLAAEDERDELAQAFGALAEGKDANFVAAIGNLAQALKSQEIKELIAEAKKTRSKQDDTIVRKINDARAREFDEKKESDELTKRLKTLERRRRELEDIEWEFKKSRFDDPRSQFGKDELVGDLLGEFLRGAITAAGYWGQWQRSQSWRAGTSDWGGGIGLPRSGRRSSRPRKTQYSGRSSGRSPWGNLPGGGGSSRSSKGSFSRPRTGSRGSRKSGGFKTGGGF